MYMQKSKLQLQYINDSVESSLATHISKSPMSELTNCLDANFLTKRSARANQKIPNIEKIVLNSKVKKLTSNFIKKLKLNSVYRQPIQDLEDQKSNYGSFNNKYLGNIQNLLKTLKQKQGFHLANFILIIWSIINILQSGLMVFIFSIMLAFSETQSFSLFTYFRIASFVIYLFDMFLNFTSQRYQSGKKLIYVGQIAQFYLRNGFIVDIISIFIFPLDMALQKNITLFLSFIYIMKLLSSIQKFERFQYLVITSTQKQQYFGLIKVLITNFVIAHFLSILLNLMAEINDGGTNWRIKLGIESSIWYVKYIWGYYWGTNVMLTVGFGDITAANQYEAICLVFIQTFSCITLTYNISYVGGLISSIRSNQEKKKKKIKTFHQMCKQNDVSNQIQTKITNYIQEAYQIKENFQYQAHDQLMTFLPKNFQKEYRIQANKILFDSLGFLNNFHKKTLLKLAQKVNRRICHPQQIILKRGQISDFMILQKGCLVFTCRSRSSLDGKAIQMLQAQGKQNKPKILSLDFIKNKQLKFNIKSIDYSVMYFLKREQFMQILKISEMDYQLFCVLKDRQQNIIDQNNLYLCSICKNQYHNKFQCSRLHFIPLKQIAISRQMNKQKKQKQQRKQFKRYKKRINSLQQFFEVQKDGKKYINLFLDEQELLFTRAQTQKQNLRSPDISNEQMISGNMLRGQSKIASLKTQIFKSLKQIIEIDTKRRKFNTNYIKTIVEQNALEKLEEIMCVSNKKDRGYWENQCDLAHDFKYYFKDNNPQNLSKFKKMRKSKP